MAMSNFERMARDQISDVLGKQGYRTYALLLQQLELNLTEDPTVVGFLDTKNARITVNRKLRTKQISTIIRHEILHAVLSHMARQLALAKKDPKFQKIPHDIFNIAADFEISNLGYTDDDKYNVRRIILNNNILKGLVTEDHFPDWQNKSFEEMIELLIDMQEKLTPQLINQIQIANSTGNEEVQELEDIIRRLEDVVEAAEKEEEKAEEASQSADTPEAQEKHKQEAEEAGSIEDLVSKLKEKAEKLKEKAEELQKSTEHQKSDTISPTKAAEDAEIARRAAVFKKILENPKITDLIKGEATSKILKATGDLRNKKDLKKYNNNPITHFELSLSSFVKKAISDTRDSTWKKINTVYARSSIVRPARARVEAKKIPLINVYFDRSGSFSGYPEKTRAAEEIIKLLNKYVKQGKLKVELYYGAVHVHTDKEAAEREGGGMESGPVLEHIKKTKPDNVIVLTDSDSEVYGKEVVTVPGAVWILFFEYKSNLGDHLKGERETNVYLSEVGDY